ncbi:Zn-binding Pro-Ala-Ala-Arg (PAAR) domain-containing protein, incolved in TypeVI secretion [Paraburkholderia fungorum]|uniref:Zn-binding Pro-Ala-Ala-Arg (PAAR) domain-containing protein, incolved in TypeVI secretion n=1 Tax=Paraburkholderia fungorum TaxID=134537 RepID=A0A1H0YXH3_9BURK|nr:PAAR domain-containing protein [Paraburkholderia fungorum]SDQ19556.1 Zn-binding Pro-Ala-Ala-Arg (PAAR) domain-containing protein, incolved in TypeVI secretion [Paraburkholderia fungorum]
MSSIACEGDTTSHGGKIISASATTGVGDGGRRAARLGDLVQCPKCKGTFPIVTTQNPAMTIEGVPLAFHGDKTACGAVLIAAQSVTTGNVPESMADAPAAADPAIAAVAPTICRECLAHAAETGASTVVRS